MRLKIISILLLVCIESNSIAQSDNRKSSNTVNPIQTAAPFLTISPDARSGALGDAGVAISPDGNALHWNPSKLAFLESSGMFSLSYSPWLKNIIPNIFLSYGTFVRKLDDRNTFGTSFRYFNLGNVELYDENKTANGTYHPYEFSIDGSIARKFGDNFSIGLTLRYLYSLLTNTTVNQGQSGQGNNVLAADESLSVPYNGQSSVQATLQLKALPAYNAALVDAYESWVEAYTQLILLDHAPGGPTDTAERAIVLPMVSTICNHSLANGWPTCPNCP